MDDRPAQVSVESLTESVARGVLRALEARIPADSDFDIGKLTAEQGIFASLVVYAGQWPTDPGQSRLGGPSLPA